MIVGVELGHPVRVGIDGVDGAGKTRLADELVEPVRRLGRPVLRASIDSFHNPETVRYRRGRGSPEGFFRDSFNCEALRSALLNPLGPGGSREFRTAIFDYRTDSELNEPAAVAADDAVLLFDGIFLQRRELAPCWDYGVFLDVPFEITHERMAQRDGISAAVEAPENRRYVEGQRMYLAECHPREAADVVIDNHDIERPRFVRRG